MKSNCIGIMKASSWKYLKTDGCKQQRFVAPDKKFELSCGIFDGKDGADLWDAKGEWLGTFHKVRSLFIFINIDSGEILEKFKREKG